MTSSSSSFSSFSSSSLPVAGTPPAPITLLILALGGEGGGVLHDWIVQAAIEAGHPVQGTSIPGVAQRTGATSYYIEMLPVPHSELGGLEPVFCLSPAPGELDLLVSSELLETARALERGLSDPKRTTLISSTHRVLTVQEKSGMGDGRWLADPVPQLAQRLSHRAVLFDMAEATQKSGTVISAVMFGAIAGTGVLPLSRTLCEAVIARHGRGVQASLAGFALGFAAAQTTTQTTTEPTPQTTTQAVMQTVMQDAMPAADLLAAAPQKPAARPQPPSNGHPVQDVPAVEDVEGVPFPRSVAQIARLGVERLTEWQDKAWAQEYLHLVAEFVAQESGRPVMGEATGDFAASCAAARFLALWMSYEDVIRVADLKTRAARLQEIRERMGAGPQEPVIVRDFLKPGVEEIASILPPSVGRRMRQWGRRRGREALTEKGIRFQTHSIAGLLAMRLLASLRWLRPHSLRMAEERALIARWASALSRALAVHRPLALQIAQSPRLIKGYADTAARGKAAFEKILTTLIEPALQTDPKALDARAEAIAKACEAALADPQGRALAQALGLKPPEPAAVPIRFIPRSRKAQ